MKETFINSHMNASKKNNNNDDFIKEINLNVPHYDMATVAEGLKDSFMAEPTSLVLTDDVYHIQLVVMWMPRPCSDASDMCTFDHRVFWLYHNDEKVCEWSDGQTEEYKFGTIDFKKIQYRINRIVEKDMQEVRHSGVNLNDPNVKYWMTGRMLMMPVVPIPEQFFNA